MEQTHARCYRCGTELPIASMNPLVSPTIAHRADLALTADWLCPDCFRIVRENRKSSSTRQRIYQRHDLINYIAVDTLNRTLHHEPGERSKMRELPKGLRCEREDFDRIADLRGDYHATGPLQEDVDALAACFRLVRNRNQCPYFVPETRSVLDYPELKERLARWEVA